MEETKLNIDFMPYDKGPFNQCYKDDKWRENLKNLKIQVS